MKGLKFTTNEFVNEIPPNIMYVLLLGTFLLLSGCGGSSSGGPPPPVSPPPPPPPDETIGIWPISASSTPDCTQDGFAHRLLSGADDLHPGWDTCDDNAFDVDGIAGNDNDNDPANIGFDIHSPLDGVVSGVRLWTFDTDPGTPDCPSFCRQGNFVLIRHPDIEADFGGEVVQTTYMHMADGSVLVQEGDIVNQGDAIGRVAKTGDNINTIHLHFGLLIGPNPGVIDADDYINPLAILPYTLIEPHRVQLARLTDTSMYDGGECAHAANSLQVDLTQREPALDTIRIEVEPEGQAVRVLDINERIGVGVDSSSARDDFDQGCTSVDVDDFNESSTHYVLRVHFGDDFSAVNNYTVRLTNVRGEVNTLTCTIAMDNTPVNCA